MLLVLSEQEKSSFSFLSSLPEQVYPDLVKTALSQLLSSKQNTKVINSAATKLKVSRCASLRSKIKFVFDAGRRLGSGMRLLIRHDHA